MKKRLNLRRETLRHLQESPLQGNMKALSPGMKRIEGGTLLCTPTPTIWEVSVAVSTYTARPSVRPSLRAIWHKITEVTDRCTQSCPEPYDSVNRCYSRHW